jgi:heme exporter protein C
MTRATPSRVSLANPKRFMKWALPVAWPLLALSILLLMIGSVWGLFFSPPDYQQGESVRIMYVHVPASWMALFAYGSCACAAFVLLIWRHGLAAVALRAMLPLGLAFTTLSLLTGSLWGKPMWGTWWVWDARLTAMLILWFLYLGVIYLLQSGPLSSKQERLAAIFTLVGAINLPIIKWSVNWWQTLHQPASILRAGGNAIHSAFMGPLLTMALAFTLLFAGLTIFRMGTILLERRR